MISKDCKRLAEVNFPIAEVSQQGVGRVNEDGKAVLLREWMGPEARPGKPVISGERGEVGGAVQEGSAANGE
jgi:hypothetical protein